MWYWMRGGGWGLGWGFGMLVMMAFWILVIAAIVWFARGASGRSALRSGSPGGDTPLDVLQRRYANGEIGRDEYEQKRRDLAK